MRITPESLARRLQSAIDSSPAPLTDSDRTTAMRLVRSLDRQGRFSQRQTIEFESLIRRLRRRSR